MQFHTICHELGHLFCYHQFYTESKRRNLTIKNENLKLRLLHGLYVDDMEYIIPLKNTLFRMTLWEKYRYVVQI